MGKTVKMIKGLALAMAVAAFPMAASAGYEPKSAVCSDGDAWKKFDPTPIACAGAFETADVKDGILDLVAGSFKASSGVAEWTLSSYADAGKSKDLEGLFGKVQNSRTGTIELTAAPMSMFVLALFADDQFSLYLFEGGEKTDRIKFSTAGVSFDKHGNAEKLIAAALFEAVQPPPSVNVEQAMEAAVPVPAALPLLGGLMLAGGAVAARRSRRKNG